MAKLNNPIAMGSTKGSATVKLDIQRKLSVVNS